MNTKEFSLQAGDKNSIFVWSSPFQKSFKEMPEVNDDMTVIVTNAAHTYVHIYNTKGYTEEEIMEVVKAHCRFVCSGCNYKYELIKKVGNCYFVN